MIFKRLRVYRPTALFFAYSMFSSFINRVNKTHVHIARNMLLVGFYVAIGKIAGASREVVIANEYGVSSVVDQFVLVSTFVLLIPAVWVSVSVSVLVPVCRGLPDEQRSRFLRQLTAVVLVCALGISLILPYLLPTIMSWVYPEAHELTGSNLTFFAQSLAPLAGAGLVVGLLSAQLLVLEKHANTLLEGIPALSVLLCVLFWPTSLSAWPLVLGSLLGALLHILALSGLLKKASAFTWPEFNMQSPAWQGFKTAIGIMVAGKIIMSFVAPVEQLIAVNLGDGAVATLNYANKVIALLLGLGATAIGRAILPVLSGPKSEQARMRTVALQWSAFLLVFGVVVALTGWVLSDWSIALLFERGAFSAQDTTNVAEVLRAGVVQLPFFFASIVLVQLFASRQMYVVLFVTSAVSLLVKAASSYYLSLSFGISGIALGTAAMYAVNCLILIFALRFIHSNNE